MPCCSQTNGLSGLGQAEELALLKSAVGVLQQFAAEIKSMWDELQRTLGIGAGRMEADVIVPYQNEIHLTVLAPVSDFLDRVQNRSINPTCSECQGFLAELTGVEERWLNYLHYTQWYDGRAAQQAEMTLSPYFIEFKAELQQCVAARCAGGITGNIGYFFTNADGSLNLPVVAGAAGLAYLLFKKGK